MEQDTRIARTKPRLQRGQFARTIGISMSVDEAKQFEDVCAEYGMSKSEMFRHILRSYLDVLHKIEPPRKKRKENNNENNEDNAT